jgi:hypothetical protein
MTIRCHKSASFVQRLAVLAAILGITVAGCSTVPIQGGFQQVCDRLVAMGPAERASQMGANHAYYDRIYGIKYDAVTDALYTVDTTGKREYILEGDLIRATFLIDRRKGTSDSNSR